MNKKINYVILFSAIASILFFLIYYIVIKGRSIWVIIEMLSYALLAFWAVGTQKKVIAFLGSALLLISPINFHYHMMNLVTYLDYRYIDVVIFARNIAIFASVFLLITTFKKKRKLMFVLPLTVLAILNLLEILADIWFMLLFDYFDISLVCNVGASGCTIIFFTALSMYVLVDNKPFERKSALRKEYIHQKNITDTSLADQLNQIKSELETGKITADEYKERRMELLKNGQ